MILTINVIISLLMPSMFIINGIFTLYNFILLGRSYKSSNYDEVLKFIACLNGVSFTIMIFSIAYNNSNLFRIWEINLDDIELNKRQQRQLKILKLSNNKRLWLVKIKSFFIYRNREKYLKNALNK